MKYNKQDLPKIVVLAIVLVGLVIYISISYSRESEKYRKRAEAEHAAAHRQQASANPNAPGVPPANGAMSAGNQLSPTVQALLTPVAPPARDPFFPVIAPPRYSAPSSVKPGTKPRGPKPLPEPLVLPPLIEGSSGQPPFQRQSNALALTGIVLGTPPLAVMRRGTDHFIVKQGEELPGKVRVQAITRNSVTLRDGKREYTLKIGQ